MSTQSFPTAASRAQHRRDMKHPHVRITRIETTVCPKIGLAQWACSYGECVCHLKGRICKFDNTKEYRCDRTPCILCHGPQEDQP